MNGSVTTAAAVWIAGVFLLSALIAAAAGEQGGAAKFGAWALQCDRATGASDQQCGLTQVVRSEENQKVAVVIIVRKSPTLKVGSFEVIAPEGVLLPEGIKFKIDQADIGQLPFIKCVAGGCIAQGVLDDRLAEKLKNGRIGVVTIYMNPGEGLRHLLTLHGFKEGYEALK